MHFTGTCLCGEITFTITRPFHTMGHCYCSLCRIPRAGVYKHWAMLGHNQFHWTGGQEAIESVEVDQGRAHLRCSYCKDVLVSQEDGVLPKVAVDAVDSGERPVAHIFVANRAVWHEIADRVTRQVPEIAR